MDPFICTDPTDAISPEGSKLATSSAAVFCSTPLLFEMAKILSFDLHKQNHQLPVLKTTIRISSLELNSKIDAKLPSCPTDIVLTKANKDF